MQSTYQFTQTSDQIFCNILQFCARDALRRAERAYSKGVTMAPAPGMWQRNSVKSWCSGQSPSPSTTVSIRQQPSTTVNFRQKPSTSIKNRQLPSTSVNFSYHSKNVGKMTGLENRQEGQGLDSHLQARSSAGVPSTSVNF